jgi:hypothetical protein
MSIRRCGATWGNGMAVYLVTYDLHKPGNNYADILEQIKRSPGWAKLSESSYAISTQETVDIAYKRIHAKVDDNDTLYMITLRKPWNGRGPKNVNDWLDTHLQ